MNTNSLDAAWIEGQLRNAQWQTASSGAQTCVMVAFLDKGIVAMGDTKNPGKMPLLFTDEEYDAFRTGIMRGELRRP